MRSPRAHAAIDYAFSFFVMAGPLWLGLSWTSLAAQSLLTLGAMRFAYSAATRYRDMHPVPIRPDTHRTLDLVWSFMVPLPPFVLGYWRELSFGQLLPLFLVGACSLALVDLGTQRARPAVARHPLEPVPQEVPAEKKKAA